MRIAYCMINCNRRDGSARAVNEVAERLAVKHEVHLYARKAEDLDLSKIRWHRIIGPSEPEVADFYSYHLAASMVLRLRSNKYDIRHSIGCNAHGANVITIQNVQPAKRKVLNQLGSVEKVSFPRRTMRRLYLKVTSAAEKRLYTHRPGRRPPVFLPVSRGVERELREHYKIGPAPVRIIPNAADTSVFRPLTSDQRAAWRAANGLLASDFVCIFSGGEWARKGLDLAIRAIGLLDRPAVKLFVAGDDSARDRFQNLAQECRLGNRVLFGGFRSDISEALASSDLFLFPSWYEAFSLATIEAAACGLPVVATKINGTEDFIQPGINGEFIEHDPEHIASVLRPLVSDIALCNRMGIAARKLVEANYTWDRIAEMTEAAYTEYLNAEPLSSLTPLLGAL